MNRLRIRALCGNGAKLCMQFILLVGVYLTIIHFSCLVGVAAALIYFTPLKAKIQKILEVAVIREIQKWETGLELDEENLMRERISECIDWENKIQQKMKSAHAESNRVIQKVVDADKDHLRPELLRVV